MTLPSAADGRWFSASRRPTGRSRRPLGAVEQQGGHHDAVHRLVAAPIATGGRVPVVGCTGRAAAASSTVADRSRRSSARPRSHAGGRGRSRRGNRRRSRCRTGPGSGSRRSRRRGRGAPGCPGHAGQGVEGLHGLVALELVGGPTLRHASILPNRTERARITGQSLDGALRMVGKNCRPCAESSSPAAPARGCTRSRWASASSSCPSTTSR